MDLCRGDLKSSGTTVFDSFNTFILLYYIRVLTRILKTGVIESLPGKMISWEFDLENLEF